MKLNYHDLKIQKQFATRLLLGITVESLMYSEKFAQLTVNESLLWLMTSNGLIQPPTWRTICEKYRQMLYRGVPRTYDFRCP